MILNTKLYRPKISNDIIVRKRLSLLLEENVDKAATFVIAPTGYGKSIAVSQWLESYSKQYCWLSIDEELNSADSFFKHLLYALASNFPNVFNRYTKSDVNNRLPPEKVILEYIINGFNAINDDFVLVLDDYHHINNHQINRFIEYLIKKPAPNIHLILIARQMPDVNTSKQLAFGAINEIGVCDLKLNSEELKQLSQLSSSNTIKTAVAHDILSYTEGWAVGVKLALSFYSKKQNNTITEQKIKLTKHQFEDYLLNETFVLLSKPLQDLALVSTISTTFSFNLLKAILAKADNNLKTDELKKLFDELIISMQFVIALDEVGVWYRFHHYYADFLSDLLTKNKTNKEIQQLHKRAGLFFEENQDFDKALQHGVKANDKAYVVHLFKTYKHRLLNQDQFTRLEKWLKLVPEKWQETEPEILLIRTFLHDNTSDYAAMHKDIELLQTILAPLEAYNKDHKRWLGELNASLAVLLFLSNKVEESSVASDEALKCLPEEASYMRDVCLFYKMLSLQTNGQLRGVEAEYKNALSAISFSEPDKRIRLLALKAMLDSVEGDLDGTIHSAINSIRLLEGSPLYVSAIYANYLYHTACYLKNDLTSANISIPEINKHIYLGRPYWGVNFLFTKGFVLNALGEQERLQSLVNQLYEFADNYKELPIVSIVKTFEMELSLLQQDVAKAKQLSYEANFEPYPPFCFGFFPQLTQIKLWINFGTENKLQLANEKLIDLIAFGNSTNRINLLLSALPLHALAYHLLGDKENCRSKLIEALHLSEPRGYIRNFIDVGSLMQTLIEECLYDNISHPYLKVVYQAFLQENLEKRYITGLNVKNSFIDSNSGKVKITVRELNLLKMLHKDMQNIEIAEELGITRDSVKKSLYRLYKKLGVHNRSSAIFKSIQVGLLRINDK